MKRKDLLIPFSFLFLMGFGGTTRTYSCSRIKGNNKVIKKRGINRKHIHIPSQGEIDEIKKLANW